MKNIFSYNEKRQAHGYWEWCWGNGKLNSKGNFVNGIKTGYWEWYYDNGNLKSKQFYI